MISLQNLLAEHHSLLVIDCASSAVQVGLARTGAEPIWVSRAEEAGTGLFAALAEIEAKSGQTLEAVGAYAFNHGPGSILGIRTAAVAVRTWAALYERPVYHFKGLALLAGVLAKQRPSQEFTVIADARRETWHSVEVQAGAVGPLLRRPTGDLAGLAVLPHGYRTWTALPAEREEVPYRVAELLAAGADLGLFELTSDPDAFLHEDPQYQTWSAQIHRAPPPS